MLRVAHRAISDHQGRLLLPFVWTIECPRGRACCVLCVLFLLKSHESDCNFSFFKTKNAQKGGGCHVLSAYVPTPAALAAVSVVGSS